MLHLILLLLGVENSYFSELIKYYLSQSQDVMHGVNCSKMHFAKVSTGG